MRTRHALAAGVAVALTASIAAPSVAAKKPKQVFIDLQNFSAGEPDHIDPALTSTLNGAQVSILMFDSLTDTNENGDLVPAAASKWSSADNGKTWVFNIKKNKFSNGEPVLPSSFVRGWLRATDPKAASEVAYHSYIIDGFEDWNNGKGAAPTSVVADDKKMTLTVTLKNAFQGFPEIASHPVFSPMPKASEGADTKLEENGMKLIGNGPYKLKSAISKTVGGQVTLVRNPLYTGTKGTLDEIQFKISKDVDSTYNAFESGQGQSGPVPAGKYKDAVAKYGDEGTGTLLATDYWGFNWEDPVVGGAKNVLLRKAIAKAVDRTQIADQIYQGSRKPTDQLVPKGIPGYTAGIGLLGGKPRDLDGAKADFAAWKAAGNELKEPVRFTFNDNANWDKVALIMIANLKDAGIDAVLAPVPNQDGKYFSKMRKGEGQIIRAGWFADYVLYDNFMYPLLHSDSIDGDNLERYKNPAFDKLIDQARASADKKAAAGLYVQAEKVALVDDAIIFPTVNRAGSAVFATNVKNVKRTPLGFLLYNQMTLA